MKKKFKEMYTQIFRDVMGYPIVLDTGNTSVNQKVKFILTNCERCKYFTVLPSLYKAHS